MTYLLVFGLLILAQLFYFKIAKKYNIVDKPNHRSLHITPTLRGGGIIFWFAVACYFILSGYQYSYFFAGVTLVATISFIDDIRPLPNTSRITVHIIAILLILYQVGFSHLNIYTGLLILILAIGILNAFNFMDGINGITVAYSLLTVATLLYVNLYLYLFIESNFLIILLISTLIFGFFNFRIQAISFAGDVGSITIAACVIFVLSKLIFGSQQYYLILILSVYGVDSIFTIIQRLQRKENIFEAHKTHFFQIMVSHLGLNHLKVSCIYFFLQAIINFILILLWHYSFEVKLLVSAGIVIVLAHIYFFFKRKMLKMNVDG